MRKSLTILSVSAVLVSGLGLALSAHAQTTDGRGVIRSPSTDQSGRNMTSKEMNEMMENCNNMMRNMQGHPSQMPNQQGTGPSSPRSGN